MGASSSYSKSSLKPVPGTARQGQTIAAPSSSHSHAKLHAVSHSSVDTAKHGGAATAADQAPPDSAVSQVDHPGLSGPQENALPAYQVEAQGRAKAQKGGARDLNKPQDLMGTAVEPGTKVGAGPAAGSAERPLHVTGAKDVPHGNAVEPSYNKAPAQEGKADRSFQQAAKAFATSPTEADAGL